MTQLMTRRTPRRAYNNNALTLDQVKERFETMSRKYNCLLREKDTLDRYISRNYIHYNGLYFER